MPGIVLGTGHRDKELQGARRQLAVLEGLTDQLCNPKLSSGWSVSEVPGLKLFLEFDILSPAR